MTLPIYQIDAFADSLFTGNPAAIIPLTDWLSDELMQQIAAENNLSDTAYIVKEAEGYRVRWFTPAAEVDLCGHATLASAYYLFHIEQIPETIIRFQSRSGWLSVEKQEDWLWLDFPTMPLELAHPANELLEAMGLAKAEFYRAADDWVLVVENEEMVQKVQPNFSYLKQLPVRGIIVTAASSQPNVDFVCRFFAPAVGVDEDPVTGSAYTKLMPFWRERLGAKKLTAKQLSKRGGSVQCEWLGDRVRLGGKAVLYLKGEIFLKP